MGTSPENQAKELTAAAETALTPTTPGLLTRGEEFEEPKAEAERDTRLDQLPMRLNVSVKVRSFRVQDLLTLEKGTVVETIHEHAQDVPIQCGGALLMWAEFEMMGQKLAVRVTRLA